MIAKDTLNNSSQQQVTVTYNPPDTTGPAVTISYPQNNATVTSANLTVTGTASDSGLGNDGVSSVTVNGVTASGGAASGANTANWSASITLSPGRTRYGDREGHAEQQHPTADHGHLQPAGHDGPGSDDQLPGEQRHGDQRQPDGTGTASDSGLGNDGVSSVTVNGVTASGGTASGANTANWSAPITLSPGRTRSR